MFGDVGADAEGITHHFSHFNWIFSGSDMIVARGPATANTKTGRGARRARVRSRSLVRRLRDPRLVDPALFIYLDPDYAGKDTARYPWLG